MIWSARVQVLSSKGANHIRILPYLRLEPKYILLFIAIEHVTSQDGELNGGPSCCGLAHPSAVRLQRYTLHLDSGRSALVKKILLASGDRQGDQGIQRFHGILFICSGAVQPWSVFSVRKTPVPRMKQKVLPSAEKVPQASYWRGPV